MQIKIDEDNSFYIRMEEASYGDKTLRFGPLSTTINDLLCMGFHLECWGFWKDQEYRQYKIRLVRRNETYLLSKASFTQLQQAHCLSEFVRDGVQLVKAGGEFKDTPTLRNLLAYREEVVVLPRYSTSPRRKTMMVGNSTFKEALRGALLEPIKRGR